MRSLKFLMSSLILSVIALGISLSPVSACEPIPSDTVMPTLEDHANYANWILVGTVIGGTENGGVITEAEIEVERYLKGEGSAIIYIDGFGHGTACLATVNLGDTYIFFAEGNLSDTFSASYFDNRRPITVANEENIERVIAVTNQSILPAPLPLTMQIERAIDNTLTWKLLAIVASGIMLVILGILKFSSGKRKTKAKRS